MRRVRAIRDAGMRVRGGVVKLRVCVDHTLGSVLFDSTSPADVPVAGRLLEAAAAEDPDTPVLVPVGRGEFLSLTARQVDRVDVVWEA